MPLRLPSPQRWSQEWLASDGTSADTSRTWREWGGGAPQQRWAKYRYLSTHLLTRLTLPLVLSVASASMLIFDVANQSSDVCHYS